MVNLSIFPLSILLNIRDDRYRQSANLTDWNSSYVRMQKLDKYHGQASGVFGCDEHLAGTMPSRGTELCTVVETMFSYETLFEIQGDPIFGTYNTLDRSEMMLI